MKSFDVTRCRGGQGWWMPSSRDDGSPNDISGPPQWQAKHGRKQARQATGRHAPHHSATSVNAGATSCQNAFYPDAVGRAEGGAGGEKKGRNCHKNFVRSSKVSASTSPHTPSMPAGPGTQSPAMPQSSSVNHQPSQSVHLSTV